MIFIHRSSDNVIARKQSDQSSQAQNVIPECLNRESMDPRQRHSRVTKNVRSLCPFGGRNDRKQWPGLIP